MNFLVEEAVVTYRSLIDLGDIMMSLLKKYKMSKDDTKEGRVKCKIPTTRDYLPLFRIENVFNFTIIFRL